VSIENVKSNIVNVAVSGATRILNLEQVLFAVVGSTTSTVYINEGASVPANLVIEGDFRNLVAGAGGAGMNSGPIFGAFTETGAHGPVVINFDKLNRYVDASTLTFSKYGTVAAFTYTLLENPINVLGNSGYSIQDVGIFSVNKYGGFLAAPVQSAAATAHSGGTVPDNTYYLKIVAKNAQGVTTGSNEVSIVVAGTVADTSTLTANWAASTGATGYDVYIGTSAGAENKVQSVGAVTTLVMTALPGTSGTVPTSNTAQILNTKEIINAKNVTHQIPSGTNWVTTFVDASSVTYVESLQDLVGGP
jgi:hypothetical protein